MTFYPCFIFFSQNIKFFTQQSLLGCFYYYSQFIIWLALIFFGKPFCCSLLCLFLCHRCLCITGIEIYQVDCKESLHQLNKVVKSVCTVSKWIPYLKNSKVSNVQFSSVSKWIPYIKSSICSQLLILLIIQFWWHNTTC